MHKRVLFGGAALAAMAAFCGVATMPVAAQDASSAAAAPASSSAPSTPAASDQDVLAQGKHVWSDAACANCHGANAQGGSNPDFPKGPNLRTSALDPQTMLQIVECGVPGTRMPAWLKGAYTAVACYGNPLGAPPASTMVTGAYSDDDLKALVAYVQTNFMKQPMPTWSTQ